MSKIEIDLDDLNEAIDLLEAAGGAIDSEWGGLSDRPGDEYRQAASRLRAARAAWVPF
jgi:hypothetical protein